MGELVTVGNYNDRISAEIAQGVLDIENIPSYIKAQDMGGMRPSWLTPAGGAWLVVRTEDAARATELLQTPAQP